MPCAARYSSRSNSQSSEADERVESRTTSRRYTRRRCRQTRSVTAAPARYHRQMSLTDSAIASDLAPATLRSYFAGLFTERFVPEFTMLSNDGRVLVDTTVWGDGTISTIVICPDRPRDAAR
jgi:hypothetical protein